MLSRSHAAEIVLSATPAEVFRALHTPSAFCIWRQASRAIVMPEPGGIWAAAWGDEGDPDYVTVATLKVFEPPRRLVMSDYRYRAKSGPLPFQVDFVTEFVVAPHPAGAKLRVTQDRFPCDAIADDFYAACENGWHATLEGLRMYFVRR
jgi:uncharacterized protein YndB with AHSA1/START domain